MSKERFILTLDSKPLRALRRLVGARNLSAEVDTAIAAYIARQRHLAAVERKHGIGRKLRGIPQGTLRSAKVFLDGRPSAR